VAASPGRAKILRAGAGETVFSLCAAGHPRHARKNPWLLLLNKAAIAVLEARATGAKRVAVFDFDVHHGNGTRTFG